MKSNHYLLVKNSISNEAVYIDYSKNKGFTFTPKNSIKYKGITVNKMILVKPSLIEKILRKKIKKQLDLYLQYIIQIMDDDDADPTNLRFALNELSRYKKTIQNNYRIHLEKRYVELLMKKIKVLEQELKTKLIYAKTYEQEETKGRRSR